MEMRRSYINLCPIRLTFSYFHILNRLAVDLGKGTKSFTTARKRILRLVGLQCLVAECCKIQKIQPCEVCKVCIYLYYAWKKLPFSRQF